MSICRCHQFLFLFQNPEVEYFTLHDHGLHKHQKNSRCKNSLKAGADSKSFASRHCAYRFIFLPYQFVNKKKLCLSVCQSVCLSVCLSVYIYIGIVFRPSVLFPTICSSVCSPVCPSVCSSVYPSLCKSFLPFVPPSICPSVRSMLFLKECKS